MITHKERIVVAIRPEMADLLPYAPCIYLWHNENSMNGTLPEKHKGHTQDEISQAEAWALHKVMSDLLDIRGSNDVLHRGIGVFSNRHSVHLFRFSSNVDIRVSRQGNSTRIKYHISIGLFGTRTAFTEELRKAGSTIAVITEQAIKEPED